MGGRGNPSEGLDFLPSCRGRADFFFHFSEVCYRFDGWSGGPWLQDGGVWGGAVSPQNSADLLPGHTAEKRGKRGGGQAQGSSLSCQPCFSSDLPSVLGGSFPALGAPPLTKCFSIFFQRETEKRR